MMALKGMAGVVQLERYSKSGPTIPESFDTTSYHGNHPSTNSLKLLFSWMLEDHATPKYVFWKPA